MFGDILFGLLFICFLFLNMENNICTKQNELYIYMIAISKFMFKKIMLNREVLKRIHTSE